MLPLFKSDFSIGKSILNLNLPSSDNDEYSSDSIFDMAVSNNLTDVVLVEDCLTGFLEALKNAESLNINLIFGLRISICQDCLVNPKDSSNSDDSKIIIFAKNKKGCNLLNKIYSFANVEGWGRIDYKHLSDYFSDDLILAIPFYDSFLFNNCLNFKNCIPDFSFCKPQFFIERNGLPFDLIVEPLVKEYCIKNKYDTYLTKSIFYKRKKDFAAFQTYKCICNRSFGARARSLDCPNLDHSSSDEFSFESYLEHESS
jgi:DNA polymerase III alpha subunit